MAGAQVGHEGFQDDASETLALGGMRCWRSAVKRGSVSEVTVVSSGQHDEAPAGAGG